VKPENHLKAAYLRAIAVDYGKHFIGIPYRWGGDSPMEGFDCSGFVVEILQAVGILQHTHDYSADALYTIFKPNIVALGYAGCLAFWLDDAGRAVHVMLMVDNRHVIGASGGGPETATASDAVQQNAYVKLRPLTYRKGTPVVLDPFKGVPA
jgi:cell wall-associated NlpC family hydrolase